MTAHDCPTACDAQRPAEQDIAEEVSIVVQPRRGYVRRDHKSRPGTTISQVALEDRCYSESGRRMPGRKRTALTGRPIAAHRPLDTLRECLRDEQGTNQVEAEV